MVKIMIASVEEEPAPMRIALGSNVYQVMHAQLSARLSALEPQPIFLRLRLRTSRNHGSRPPMHNEPDSRFFEL